MAKENGVKFGVHSEVGQLRKVMVCAPGKAHTRLTPSNSDALLFDDVLWVDAAKRDHFDWGWAWWTKFGVISRAWSPASSRKRCSADCRPKSFRKLTAAKCSNWSRTLLVSPNIYCHRCQTRCIRGTRAAGSTVELLSMLCFGLLVTKNRS